MPLRDICWCVILLAGLGAD